MYVNFANITLFSLKTRLELYISCPGWSILASITLSMNLRVVTFLQHHPSAFYQNVVIVLTADWPILSDKTSTLL
jgi:hypothetical protein